MTYCVAIAVDAGLVFAADSRTHAGVDQVSTYSKMHTFGCDGNRQVVLLSAGNLATTQAVITQIRRARDERAAMNVDTARDMAEALTPRLSSVVKSARNHRRSFSSTLREISLPRPGTLGSCRWEKPSTGSRSSTASFSLPAASMRRRYAPWCRWTPPFGAT